MFSISYKNKCLFWHVHKNAGSYIEFVLKEYYNFDDFNYNAIITKMLEQGEKNNIEKNNQDNQDNLDFKDDIKCECSNKIKEYGLMGFIIKENNEIFNEQKYNFEEYNIFSVIRNPYDRAISSYEFIIKKKFDTRLNENFENVSFKDFYANYEKYSKNVFILTHALMTQYENIKNNYNSINVNIFCDYTNLDLELVNVLKKINVPNPYKHIDMIKNNFKINTTKKKNITTYYCEESLQLINELFKDDFEKFNFPIYNNLEELNNFLIEYNNKINLNNKKILEDYILEGYDKVDNNESDNILRYQSKFR